MFTPTLFVGAALGMLLRQAVHCLHGVRFAVRVMAALLAAATHAPWMASLITVELTGTWTILPLVLMCNLLARQIAQRLLRHSLYSSASDLSEALPRAEPFPEEKTNREAGVLPSAED